MPFIGVQPASALLTSADIQDGQITTAKIADTAVTTAKITDDAVTGSKIENSPTIANGLTLTDGDITLASGHGISFASTSDVSGMTSELLDDYEEGSWTPRYGCTTTDPTITHHTQAGRYIRVGRFVHCQGRIRTTSVSGGSGSVQLEDLPFTNAAISNIFSSFNIGYSNNWGSDRHPHAGYVTTNDTVVRLICFDSSDPRDGFVTNLDQNDFNTSSGGNNDLIFSIQYIIDG